MAKKPAVIFDMDGTLCDVTAIRHYVLDTPRRNYHAFHYLSIFCPPHDWVREAARKHHAEGKAVLIVTARDSSWGYLTKNWLETAEVPYEWLSMRRLGDYRPDKLVKGEILDRLLERYDVQHAYDDNPSIIELWDERQIPRTVVPGWA